MKCNHYKYREASYGWLSILDQSGMDVDDIYRSSKLPSIPLDSFRAFLL